MKQEYSKIKDIPTEKRAEFGRTLNEKKQKIAAEIEALENEAESENIVALDITAPCAPNSSMPEFLTADQGSKHPLMTELDRVISIYQSMGFDIVESQQLDDEFHMFDSLNFAKEHQARDNFDTSRTEEG